MRNRFCLITVLLHVACRGDYSLPLPNGYELQRLSKATGAITKVSDDGSHEIVVPPAIVSYQVVGSVVIGELRLSPSDQIR